MNYRSILKEFDQSIIAENKKLMETYNKLLKESEDVCPKCKKSPCVCDKEEVTECGDQVQEDDMLKDREHNLHISAKKFFENEDDVTDDVAPVEGDGDKEVQEVSPDETVADDTETVDEGDDDGNLVSAEEFFGKADTSDTATDDTTNTSKEAEPVEKTGDEEEKVDEASKTMTPSSLFEDEEKKDEEEKPVEGDKEKEEIKESEEVNQKADKSEDKAEFFAEECNKKEEKKGEPVENVDENCTGEKKDDEKKEKVTEEVEDKEEENKEPVEESEEDEDMTDSEKEMKELQESMDAVKMFVKANKRFFPVNG